MRGISYDQTNRNFARTVTIAAAQGLPVNGQDSGLTSRDSRRYSVTALYSMAAEQDVEVEDELSNAQKRLRQLKSSISSLSKKNFTLERDVRYLDGRIALLIQNHMALEEFKEVASHLDDDEITDGAYPDDRKIQQYGGLFFLLQTEPRHVATLVRLVSLGEIDTLLQTVMFTLYGNQYESREEHLLLSMFQSVLANQFDSATEFGGLLRANTPVSRMMNTYTRRGPGQSYLKTVLSDCISNVIKDRDRNLEINPLKVYEQIISDLEDKGLPVNLPRGVSAEEAQANPQVQAALEPRIQALIEIANMFLTTIIDSIDSVPYGIRWICKQIRSLTKRKYPDATDLSICSLIGGFFFLRFLNPAIVTPQAYMLIEKNPSKHPRRTLTLIAKLLQNLANKPSYAKEAYMMTLNSFVDENKTRINHFLNDLCEVGDFYESLEMDQYMALSKKDLSLNITLNEIYNTHALLIKHQEVLCPNDKQHIKMSLDELGPAPPQVPRHENCSIDLPLFSRWETPVDGNLLGAITQNDILYMEAKSLLVQIIRSLPHLADKPVTSLLKIADTAATSKERTLVRRGIKVKGMLSELTAAGVIDREDNFALMTQEVNQELVHLGNIREKVLQEAASLENVYKNICDHNNYLRMQLESYKAYLQNVRMQSGGKEKSKVHIPGPIKFTHGHLERDGVIVECNVPENRRNNIFFNIQSPVPGTFIIALHYKGREKPILEMDLKLDDLLEKQQDNIHTLDLEYVQLNVGKLLNLLNKNFNKR
ncbi:putative ras GTPase-activating protein sar1 [Basidiobolus meristosporus CBS 931.73]|uniref:Putative ras GTPase-activating protein sar1 n=1 Tax=Basidiobolus meristosporus CBS 931.73 TaxID=1314790 RepID=A0A1Y1YWL3_9FUNG|nr:putative ras GTPase-activating protein sar1 [Basidiobolus meristosporus CBS 931.73]|eukprot:ORY02401.1 putative ras GTPase-activating protein sar1 [Basidiobolus meristosporus CBS 931.73]